jgi:hypothetical protein
MRVRRALEAVRRLRSYLLVEPELKKALPVLAPAYRVALSDLPDEAAKLELVAVVRAHPEASQVALRRTGLPEAGYLTDRQHRLIKAAVTGMPVEPIEAERSAEFAAEAHLGRIPIDQAFDQLEALVPDLADRRAKAEAWREAHTTADRMERLRMFRSLTSGIDLLLGPRAAHSDPLVRSQVARSVAVSYISILLGDTSHGDRTTPYFTIARTPRSGTLVDRRKHGESEKPRT